MKNYLLGLGLLIGGTTFFYGLTDKAIMNIFVLVLLYGYWGIAWNISAGYTGLMSLGHALFAGIGAYSVAFLYSRYALNPWFSGAIGVILAGLMAALIGTLCFRFRVKGHYFGLLTLACSEIAFLVVSASQPLGRSDGLSLEFSHWTWQYLQFREKWPYGVIAAALLLAILVFKKFLLQSRVGFYWQALRDNEEAAEALGVPAFRYKLASIVTSAMLTALGGAFYAQYISFVDPRSVFSVELSVQILVFSIVGGMRTIWGPLLGAALLLPMGEVIRQFLGTALPGASAVLYALILIVVAMVLPQGLASLRIFGSASPSASNKSASESGKQGAVVA